MEEASIEKVMMWPDLINMVKEYEEEINEVEAVISGEEGLELTDGEFPEDYNNMILFDSLKGKGKHGKYSLEVNGERHFRSSSHSLVELSVERKREEVAKDDLEAIKDYLFE